eukprot:159820-Chlamydomonas_euryale.AAC.18
MLRAPQAGLGRGRGSIRAPPHRSRRDQHRGGGGGGGGSSGQPHWGKSGTDALTDVVVARVSVLSADHLLRCRRYAKRLGRQHLLDAVAAELAVRDRMRRRL